MCILIVAPDAPKLAAGHGNGQCYHTNELGKVLHSIFESKPLNPEIARTERFARSIAYEPSTEINLSSVED